MDYSLWLLVSMTNKSYETSTIHYDCFHVAGRPPESDVKHDAFGPRFSSSCILLNLQYMTPLAHTWGVNKHVRFASDTSTSIFS